MENKKFALHVNLNGQDTLELCLDVPSAKVDVVDMLPHLYSVADAVFEVSVKSLESQGREIACGPGCDVCCRQLISISEFEALFLCTVMDELPKGVKARVLKRFSAAVEIMERSGILARVIDAYSHHLLDREVMNQVQKAYFRLGIPCPFLEDAKCSIYPARPFICRQYLVVSDPARCEKLFRPGNEIDKVMHPLDLASAAGAFNGVDLERTRAVPLVLSRLYRGMLSARTWPTTEAGSVITGFIEAAKALNRGGVGG